MVIMVINCTIGVTIAQGPSLGLLVFFLTSEVITSNTSEEKKKERSHHTNRQNLNCFWQQSDHSWRLDFSEKRVCLNKGVRW